MGYEVALCADYELINKVTLDPDTLDQIKDDFFDITTYRPDEAGVWLQCKRDGECVGMLRARPLGRFNLRVHIYIPVKNRVNCLHIGQAFIAFINKNKGGYLKMSTTAAVKYKNVIRYCHRLGFDTEGIDKLSCQIGGIIHDKVVMSYLFIGDEK